MRFKILITIALILITKFSNGQSINAIYQVNYGPTLIAGTLPMDLHCKYVVWADNNFIEIIGIEDSLSSVIPTDFSKLVKHPTDEHIIIDKTKLIGLYVETGRFVKVKKNKIISTRKYKGCETLLIDRNSKVTVCEKFNTLMTPGVFFQDININGGVTAINTRQTNIFLISKIVKSSRILNYENKFINVSNTPIKDTFDFFKN